MKAGAKALVFDRAGNILVLRRSNTHPVYALHSDLPGGEVEIHELPEDGVLREIFEETGLELAATALELALDEPAGEKARRLLYIARHSELMPNVTLSWEHDQAEWVDMDQFINRPLPGNADTFYVMALQYVQTKMHLTLQSK